MGSFATALVCLAAMSGCAEPGPPSPETFAISYERSGGLAAMPQKLVIKPGRRGVLTTREAGPDSLETTRFRVGVKRIESLQNALKRADFESIGTPGPNPSTCADCYFYDIRYEGHEVSFSQIAVPKRLRGIVRQLEAVISAHRPFH